MRVVSEKVGFVERVGYGFGDLASCLFWQTFTVFLLFFYTDVFGIAAAAAATMLGVVRIIDLFADPVMGMIGDRTQTRWGKFRPYLFWMAVPFGLIGFLTFYAPDFAPTARLTYAYLTYGAMMLIYTAINIPYGALMGVMTPDSLVRTRLSSYRFLGAFTGNLIVQFCTVGLVKHLGGGVDRIGFRWTMAIYAVSATLLFLGTFALTRERVVPVKEQQTNSSQDVWDLLNNVPWLVLFGGGICANTWAVLKMASLLYFFKYYLGPDAGIAMLLFPDGVWWTTWLATHLPSVLGFLRYMFTGVAGFMLWGTVGNILGVLATGWMTKYLGKRNLYIVSMILNAITTAAYFIAGPHDMVFLYAMNLIGGFASGPVSPLIWALYADTADYSEWKTGRRATGLVFSAGTFAQKMGWTVGGSMAGYLLAFYGFQANVAQTESSLFGIRMLVSLIPAICAVLAVVTIALYLINEKVLARVTGDLAERRKTGLPAPVKIGLSEGLASAAAAVRPLRLWWAVAAVLGSLAVARHWGAVNVGWAVAGLSAPRVLAVAATLALIVALVYAHRLQASLHRTGQYAARNSWLVIGVGAVFAFTLVPLGGWWLAGWVWLVTGNVWWPVGSGIALLLMLIPPAASVLPARLRRQSTSAS